MFIFRKKIGYYTVNSLSYLMITLLSSVQGRLPYRPKHGQSAGSVKNVHLLEQNKWADAPKKGSDPCKLQWGQRILRVILHLSHGSLSHPEGCSLSTFQLSSGMC